LILITKFTIEESQLQTMNSDARLYIINWWSNRCNVFIMYLLNIYLLCLF